MVIDKSDYCSVFSRRKVINLILEKLWDGKDFPVKINDDNLILKEGLNHSDLFLSADEIGENSLVIKYFKKENKIEISANKLESSVRQHYALFYGFVLVVCGFINFSYKEDHIIGIYDFNQESKSWDNLSVCKLVDKIVIPDYLLRTVFRTTKNVTDMAKLYNVSVTALHRRLRAAKIL